MQFKQFNVPFSLLIVAIMITASLGCNSCNSAEADTASVEITPPPPPPPPPPVKKREEIKQAAKAEETDEEFAAIEDEEIHVVQHEEVDIRFIPHRFTYEPLESNAETHLRESMSAFDVAPHYGRECVDKKNPDRCSQINIQQYIEDNLRMPDEAKEMGALTEYVSFVVQADGEIDDANIQVVPQEPRCRECAAAALEVIRKMPKWVPGQLEGNAVAVRITLPITFSPDTEG